MTTSTSQLNEAWKYIESEEKKRAAAEKSRIAADRASLGVIKQQKLADVARVQQQISALGEQRLEIDENAAPPLLTEILKELRLLRQVETQNGRFLKAILDAVE